MFQASSSLAEISVGTDRPRRDRAGEASEQERAQRRADGLCRDCPRKAQSVLCTRCRRRIEANTERYVGQPRKGPPGKFVEIDKDLALAVRDIADAKAAIAELGALPRSAQRTEALKQARAKLALGARFVDHVVDKLGGGEG